MGDLKMAFVNERTKESWRTIDVERNAVLVVRKRDREGFTTFDLTWDGHLITFEGRARITQGASNYDVQWELNHLSVPKKLPYGETEVNNVIVEALKEFGLTHDRNNVCVSGVKFIGRPA